MSPHLPLCSMITNINGHERKHSKSQSAFNYDSTSNNQTAAIMRNELKKLIETAPVDAKEKFAIEMDNFFSLFQRHLSDNAKGNEIEWDRIQPPNPDQVVNYENITQVKGAATLLDKLVVLKLNGGLGTSMGCVGPKSVIEVREGNTFLDLTVRQIEHLNRTYGCNVPLVLMNSFNTEDDTRRVVQKYHGHNIDILTFQQSRFPRIIKDSLLPVPRNYNAPIESWYPPGHGDVFDALAHNGMLDLLISRGKEIIFISNIDNLGAIVDLNILQHMINAHAEFIMELTNKTKADVKGGTIIDYNGTIRLLEIAQVPSDHVEEFKSIKKFKYFNTNNIWVDLRAIKRVVEHQKLQMEIIPNAKVISASKKESDLNVLQLETAVGAAIRHFENAHGVNVPRRRFLPVKTCSDLFLVKSDLYSLSHGTLVLHAQRFPFNAPLVKLGNHYKKVSDFQKMIPNIPRILELDHLTITGNVKLGNNITLRGTVIIVASNSDTIDIPSGSILENVVVTGSLRILEH